MSTKRSVSTEVERGTRNRPAPTYEPTADEAQALDGLRRRQGGTAPFPRLAYREDGFKVDHVDDHVGIRLMMEACGAVDGEAFAGLLGQIIRFCAGDKDSVERGVNGLIATVAGIGPRDQTEMMLAAQMAMTHELTMTMGRQLRHAETIPQQDSAERAFNKLTRTFTTQLEALRKHRNGGQQKVTVEHVTVNEGGQAIVGAVTTKGGGVSDER